MPLQCTCEQLGGSVPFSPAITYIYTCRRLCVQMWAFNMFRQLVPYAPLRAFTRYGMMTFISLHACFNRPRRELVGFP